MFLHTEFYTNLVFNIWYTTYIFVYNIFFYNFFIKVLNVFFINYFFFKPNFYQFLLSDIFNMFDYYSTIILKNNLYNHLSILYKYNSGGVNFLFNFSILNNIFPNIVNFNIFFKNDHNMLLYSNFFLNIVISFYLFIFFYIVFNYFFLNFKNKNLTLIFSYFDLFLFQSEKENSNFEDVKFFYIIMIFLILFNFNYYFFFFLISHSYIYIYMVMLLSIVLFILILPFIYVSLLFLNIFVYLKGSHSSTILIFDQLNDYINVLSFIIRIYIQLIRLILISGVYFLLYEYIYTINFFYENSFINSYNLNNNFNLNTSYSLVNIFKIILRWLAEFFDLMFIFFLQLAIFFSILFWLFYFLFFTINNNHMEGFFFKKRTNEL